MIIFRKKQIIESPDQVLGEMYATALQIRRIEKILKEISDNPENFKKERDYFDDDALEYMKCSFERKLERLKAKFPRQCLDVESLEKII